MAGPNDVKDDLLNSILADEGGDDTNNDHGSDELENDLANDDLPGDDLGGDDNDEPDAGDDSGSDDQPEQRGRRQNKKPTTPVERQKPGQQPGGKPQEVDEFDPNVRLQEDGKGNLISPTGRIIARAGRERQLFEKWRGRVQGVERNAQRMAINTRRLADASRDLYKKYQDLEKQKGMFDQAGLSFDDQKMMLDIAVEFNRNPIDGVKKFLTMAHMRGIDISKLGVGGGVDTRFVVDSLKKDLTEHFDRQTSKREDPQAAIQREAEDFMANTPAAWELADEMGHSQFSQMMDGAKRQFPDKSFAELFQSLERQWLRSKLNNNQQQNPNTRQRQQKRPTPPSAPANRRRSGSRNNNSGMESFDQIGLDVLKDIQNLT